MLVKAADDKGKRLALLESLQQSPALDARQRGWAKDELLRTRRGVQGERDAAHYLDNYLKDSRNHAVLHDLRLELHGEVAQIDHLILGRMFDFFLLETKNFSGNLRINAQGEFSVRYGAEKEFGIPSPLEQSRRHERLLRKAFEMLGIEGRAGTRPTFHHVVLVDPKATITRPPAAEFDTSLVIKADQFRAWHEKHVEKDTGIGSLLTGMANIRSSETVEQWAKLLARLHRPADPLALPEFMKPVSPAGVAVPAAAEAPAKLAVAAGTEPDLKRKLVCATCRAKISFAEGKFCWNNEKRFGGFQYCREHQAAFPAG